MATKIKVAVLGITGLTGEELLRIFENHSGVEVVSVYSRTPQKLKDLYPHFKKFAHLNVDVFTVEHLNKSGAQVVFIALPHGQAMEFVPKILEANIKVIDLGSDFRLQDVATYEKWYQKHTAASFVPKAVYGLCEFNRNEIKKADLIANPGCYVTSATLAIKPLIESGLIEKEDIIVDAKSGVSGAGREVYSQERREQWEDSFSAYKVDGHRHLPEIEQNIGAKITFIPHLLPIDRGIIATCYLKPKKGITASQIKEVFMKKYMHENFVEVLDKSPNLKDILGTNFTQIYFTFDANGGRLVVIAALDNLTKGASGQAVQNMNLMFGLEEDAGLKDLKLI